MVIIMPIGLFGSTFSTFDWLAGQHIFHRGELTTNQLLLVTIICVLVGGPLHAHGWPMLLHPIEMIQETGPSTPAGLGGQLHMVHHDVELQKGGTAERRRLHMVLHHDRGCTKEQAHIKKILLLGVR